MNLQELKIYAVETAKENPTLKKEIYDFVQLAIDEIEEGGSENHECELARRDIEFIVNEKMNEDEMKKVNLPTEDIKVNGYSNHETYLMISSIHNNQEWLEKSFELIRAFDYSFRLKTHFQAKIFRGRTLADMLGLIAFDEINWDEIFNNLKEMMPKVRFELGDYLMIVDGDDLVFDWKRKVFVFDSYDGNTKGAIDVTDHSGEDVVSYSLFEHRFVKVEQQWRLVQESDRWISEWRNENNEIVGINYFQGEDSFNDLHEDFFFPDVTLTEKVLAKNMPIDDAIWTIIHEENITKEELLERLALANIQARIVFDILHDRECQGNGESDEELFHVNNIKLLTNINSNEWKRMD